MLSEPIVLTISFPTRTAALEMGRELVAHRLVACAQLLPIHSIYHWEGAVQSEDEVLLQAKTFRDQVPAIERMVIERHSYAVPEIIAVAIAWGHQPYLDWMARETGSV